MLPFQGVAPGVPIPAEQTKTDLGSWDQAGNTYVEGKGWA